MPLLNLCLEKNRANYNFETAKVRTVTFSNEDLSADYVLGDPNSNIMVNDVLELGLSHAQDEFVLLLQENLEINEEIINEVIDSNKDLVLIFHHNTNKLGGFAVRSSLLNRILEFIPKMSLQECWDSMPFKLLKEKYGYDNINKKDPDVFIVDQSNGSTLRKTFDKLLDRKADAESIFVLKYNSKKEIRFHLNHVENIHLLKRGREAVAIVCKAGYWENNRKDIPEIDISDKESLSILEKFIEFKINSKNIFCILEYNYAEQLNELLLNSMKCEKDEIYFDKGDYSIKMKPESVAKIGLFDSSLEEKEAVILDYLLRAKSHGINIKNNLDSSKLDRDIKSANDRMLIELKWWRKSKHRNLEDFKNITKNFVFEKHEDRDIKISAIISSYKPNIGMLKKCIECATASKTPVEIVYVSTDITVEEEEFFQNNINSIRNIVIVKDWDKRESQGMSWSKGLAVSTGQFSVNCNIDDWWSEDLVSEYLRLFEEGNDLVYGDKIIHREGQQPEHYIECQPSRITLSKYYYIGCHQGLRTDFFLDKVGWYKISLVGCSDYDYVMRYAALYGRIGKSNKFLSNFFLNPDGISSKNVEVMRKEASILKKIYSKHIFENLAVYFCNRKEDYKDISKSIKSLLQHRNDFDILIYVNKDLEDIEVLNEKNIRHYYTYETNRYALLKEEILNGYKSIFVFNNKTFFRDGDFTKIVDGFHTLLLFSEYQKTNKDCFVLINNPGILDMLNSAISSWRLYDSCGNINKEIDDKKSDVDRMILEGLEKLFVHVRQSKEITLNRTLSYISTNYLMQYSNLIVDIDESSIFGSEQQEEFQKSILEYWSDL